MPLFERNSQVTKGGRARRRVRFFSHQLAECAVGVALIAVGLQLSRGVRTEFVVIGALLLVLNLFTKGRLGVMKYLGRRLHHLGDLLIIVFSAASPFFGFVRHDVRAIIAVELVALLLIFIEQSTRYVDLPTAIRGNLSDRPARTATSRTRTIGPAVNGTAHHLGLVAGVTKRVIRARRSARKTGL